MEHTVNKRRNDYQYTEQVVSDAETVTTPAGTFPDCLHIRRAVLSGSRTADVWFKRGVGIVRAVSEEFDHSDGDAKVFAKSVSVLESYSVRGGDGYLPLALGNRWSYVGEGIPEDAVSRIEYEAALDVDDTVYLTVVEETLDPHGDPKEYALLDDNDEIIR